MNPDSPIKTAEEKSDQPRIVVEFVRDPETGTIKRVRHVPFQSGMIIERAGRRYQVDAKGTQRRI